MNKTKVELLEICKGLGFTKYKSKNKPQLVELIQSKNASINTNVNNINVHNVNSFIKEDVGLIVNKETGMDGATYNQKMEKETDILDLKIIINNNDYIKNCTSNKTKDYNSLSYLVNNSLSHSDCIKLGIGIEKVMSDIILQKNNNLENIKIKNKKGVKEKDHLFKCEELKTIYYAEIKSNLNLDTEKYKATIEKCLQIFQELKNKYPNYTIKMHLVGGRYYTKKNIPVTISSKYLILNEMLVGINEYFSELNVNVIFKNEEMYKEFINNLADSMFN